MAKQTYKKLIRA